MGIVIFWPGLVTGWLDRGPAVDPSTVRIELPAPTGLGGGLGGGLQPGGLGVPGALGGATPAQGGLGAPPGLQGQ